MFATPIDSIASLEEKAYYILHVVGALLPGEIPRESELSFAIDALRMRQSLDKALEDVREFWHRRSAPIQPVGNGEVHCVNCDDTVAFIGGHMQVLF